MIPASYTKHLTLVLLCFLGLFMNSERGWTQTTQPPLTVCFSSDCTYASIQAAVNSAKPGDTITVFPALSASRVTVSYSESIIITKPLILKGVGAIIRPSLPGDQPVITISAKGQEVIISGFTIETVGRAVGILVGVGSQAKLEGNAFRRLSGTATSVWVEEQAQASITKNLFSYVWQAIETEAESGPVLIQENIFLGPMEAIIVAGPAEIIRNQFSGSLDGVRIEGLKPVLIQENIFAAHMFAGVAVVRGTVKILDNVFVSRPNSDLRDTLVAWGVQISNPLEPSEVEISRNVIIGHKYGVGIFQPPCVDTVSNPIEVKITGRDNLITNFERAALCPTDYPWPPGFVK